MANGTITIYIKERPEANRPKLVIRQFFMHKPYFHYLYIYQCAQVASGLAYLHEKETVSTQYTQLTIH
ncbi:hypothetical protein RSOLAG1IB_09737 [Rhizoctonia solani AG-1 IB]|uniref:Protein kinase domain-containing protein n=1 Tax=Thanatephorus cucumeris (strain AG1-IB / isolate 7/3/14) TaxID=1108050 RepID=A0A0B7FSB7_THACB|nr:hypothetical protein RSOLAG1IB_09737 [Rhizoctonia solani AG-1 IB]